MATKNSASSVKHPIDHMKYMLFLNELMKEQNKEIRSEFLDSIDYKGLQAEGDKFNEKAFIREVASRYNIFIENNLDARAIMDDIIMDQQSDSLMTGLGFDLSKVSPDFVEDIGWAMAYQERLGKRDGKIPVAKMLTDNKNAILSLSDVSSSRDMFEGLSFALLAQNNIPLTTTHDQNKNTFTTMFHSFDRNSTMVTESPSGLIIMNAIDGYYREKLGLQKEPLSDQMEAFITEGKTDVINSVKNAQQALQDGLKGPHVGDYQKYILMLNELLKDENEKMFDQYVQGLLSEKGYEDVSKITIDQLIEMDFNQSVAADRLKTISNSVPEIRSKVDAYIDRFDAIEVLGLAGYDVKTVPEHFIHDVKTSMAFEAAFPDHEREHIKDRLLRVKDSFAKTMAKDSTRLALSGVMTAVACTVAGPVGIALSGANLASQFLQNKKVVELLNKGHERLTENLVKLGLKQEVVDGRNKKLGDTLKEFTENKWVRNGLKVAGIGSLAFGVGVLAEHLYTEVNWTEAVAKASDLTGKAIETVFDSETIAQASGMMDSFGNMADGAFKEANEILQASASGLGEFYESAVSASYDSANPPSSDVLSNAEKVDSPTPAATEHASEKPWSINESLLSPIAEKSIESISDLEVPNIVEHLDSLMQNSANVIDALSPDEKSLFAPSDWTINESLISEANDISNPEITANTELVTLKSGDTLWQVAKEKLEVALESKPTPQQIAALINDLNLPNPNDVDAGQVISFPKDLSVYSDVTSVQHADWMVDQKTDVPNSTGDKQPISSKPDSQLPPTPIVEKFDFGHGREMVEAISTVLPSSSSVGELYDINKIMESHNSTASLDTVSQMNANVDLRNLEPGESVKIPTENGVVDYVVPDFKDAIIQDVFGGQPPKYIDIDKYFEAVEKMNPLIDLSSGLFGNDNLGRDLVSANNINLPHVDYSDFQPDARTFILDGHGGHTKQDINDTLIRAAYPDGVPPFLDEKAVLSDIRNDNPDLRKILNSQSSFSQSITINPLDIGQAVERTASEAIVGNDANQTASKIEAQKETTVFKKGDPDSFIDRIRRDVNNSHDLTI